ncbi:hypothetical protein FQR65_LT18517 [Abscondita terminalis]|nr:hypothetical protein FQR65_LT18517 [Abscondita terminalis]
MLLACAGPVNSFEFHPCGRNSQVDNLTLSLDADCLSPTSSYHRLGWIYQACSQKANTTKTKETATPVTDKTFPYQLDKGQPTELPDELQEISGITFLPDNKEWIYAIQDEKGLLYSYNLLNKQLSYVPFEKDGDYEDLAVSNNHFIILKSNVDKALVITDDKWNIKSVSPLSRKQHTQPEGIAFDTDDNLYISNEAGNKDKAILYKFELLNNEISIAFLFFLLAEPAFAQDAQIEQPFDSDSEMPENQSAGRRH